MHICPHEHRHSYWAASARLLVSRAFAAPSPTRRSRVSLWRTGAPRMTPSRTGLKSHPVSSTSSAQLSEMLGTQAHGQTRAQTSDQPSAFTLTELHSLHRV